MTLTKKCSASISRIVVSLLLMLTFSFCISLTAKADTDYDAIDENVYRYLSDQFKARNRSIDMSDYRILLDTSSNTGMAESHARNIVGTTLQEYLDTYMVEAVEVETMQEGSNIYLASYTMTYDDCDDALFQAGVDRVLAQISPEMTDVQKVLIVHDYMVLHNIYDMETTADNSNYNAYGPLAKGMGVCEGNSMAFKYIMEQLGIECYLVHSDQKEHMWNKVIIDGEAYNVDLTRDDGGWDRLGRVWHDAFLVSDDYLINECYYPADMKTLSYGKEIDITATSTKFENSTFSNTNSAFYYYDGNYYFTRSNRETGKNEVCSMNAEKTSKWEVTLVKDIGTWYGSGDDDECVTEWCGNVVKIENSRVYYTVPNGMDSVGIESKDVREEYRVELDPNYEIYGIVELNGELVYTVQKGDDFVFESQAYYRFNDSEKVYQEAVEEPEETVEPEVVEIEEPDEEDILYPEELDSPDEEDDIDSGYTMSLNPLLITGGIIVAIVVGVVVVIAAIIIVVVVVIKKKKKK